MIWFSISQPVPIIDIGNKDYLRHNHLTDRVYKLLTFIRLAVTFIAVHISVPHPVYFMSTL